MEKTSPSKMMKGLGIVSAMAAISSILPSMPENILRGGNRDPRGRAPSGHKWRVSSWQMPRPTKVRNPKIAAQVNAMHEKWRVSRGFKKESSSDVV